MNIEENIPQPSQPKPNDVLEKLSLFSSRLGEISVGDRVADIKRAVLTEEQIALIDTIRNVLENESAIAEERRIRILEDIARVCEQGIETLTYLLNKKGLMNEIFRALEDVGEARGENILTEASKIVKIEFDLNGFKAIDDYAGHDAGDRVLREVKRILEGLSSRFEGMQFKSAREGGDEFGVLIKSSRVLEEEEVNKIKEYIKERIERIKVSELDSKRIPDYAFRRLIDLYKKEKNITADIEISKDDKDFSQWVREVFHPSMSSGDARMDEVLKMLLRGKEALNEEEAEAAERHNVRFIGEDQLKTMCWREIMEAMTFAAFHMADEEAIRQKAFDKAELRGSLSSRERAIICLWDSPRSAATAEVYNTIGGIKTRLDSIAEELKEAAGNPVGCPEIARRTQGDIDSVTHVISDL